MITYGTWPSTCDYENRFQFFSIFSGSKQRHLDGFVRNFLFWTGRSYLDLHLKPYCNFWTIYLIGLTIYVAASA